MGFSFLVFLNILEGRVKHKKGGFFQVEKKFYSENVKYVIPFLDTTSLVKENDYSILAKYQIQNLPLLNANNNEIFRETIRN